jgi:hypothetical protein
MGLVATSQSMETVGMRKEVKRSMLIWPLSASATITAMSWLISVGDPIALIRQTEPVLRIPEAIVLIADFDATHSEIALSPRSEHGARAMKLPARVAEVFGIEPPFVEAPVRDEQSELAGLGRGYQVALVEDHDSRKGLSDSGVIASLVMRDDSENDRPAIVGPSRPEFWQPEIVTFDPPALTPPSLLPESNRALGRRLLTSPQPSDVQTAAEPVELAPEFTETIQQKPTSVSTVPAIAPNPLVDDAPVVRIEGEKGAEDRVVAERSPAGWPVTRRLDEQLEALSAMVLNQRSRARGQLVSSSMSVSPIMQWSRDVSQSLEALRALPRLGDERAGALIDQLSELATRGAIRAEKLGDREQQIQWLRASYAVARRSAVWRPVWEVTRSHEPTWMVSDGRGPASQSIEETIDMVRADLEDTGDAGGWTQYLLLDDVVAAIDRGDIDERTILAQRFLSRMDWHGLDPEQRRWLTRDSVVQLSSVIRPWAQDAVDYANLMSHIERQESDAIDLAAIDIAGAFQTLRFAENAKAVEIADAIDTHYRNANVRLALSQPMLQRILPTMDPKSIPVRTSMFGSRVRGMSRIESDLHVELTPSPDRWTLRLKATGNVRTQSTGLNGPVAVRTSGNSDFVAATPIEVTPTGIQVGNPDVDVRGKTNLGGIRTDYDGWPLIGPLVRSMASSRYESLAPRSNRIANRKIETQVASEIDTQLDDRLGLATRQLSRMVLGPLGNLRLDPKVTDMQTTSHRLLARYRLAGDWQLGAFTARPRAPRTSLMSVQVHQSALNNTLEQLVPRDEPMAIGEMIQNAAATFGQSDVSIPDDIPDNVTIQFARTRPITVEIEDGQLWVTLRVVRLNRGDRTQLTRFIVRAVYTPQINGMEASLVRDGHLRISGPGMSMRQRLPVRAIFNKVLSPNRPLLLTLPQLTDHPSTQGLAVSQLELRSGWIGMAISESDAPRIALKKRVDR